MENNLVNYVFNVDKAKHHTCRLQPYTKSRSNHRYSKTNKQSAPKADFNTQNLLIEMQGLNIEFDDNLKLNSEDTTIYSNVGKLTGKIQQLNIVENENSKENDASYLNVDQPNTATISDSLIGRNDECADPTRRPRYVKYLDDDNLKLTSEDTTIYSNVGKLTGKIQQLNIVENENTKENDASYLNVDQPNTATISDSLVGRNDECADPTRRPRYVKYLDKCFRCRKKFRVFFNNDYGELQLCDAVLKHGDCYHETCAT
ncbi:hypothetical protein Ahia01_000327000 [Argonauta hians]